MFDFLRAGHISCISYHYKTYFPSISAMWLCDWSETLTTDPQGDCRTTRGSVFFYSLFYADTNFLFTNLPIVQWIQFIHRSKSTDLSQNLSLNQFSNSDRGNSHVGGKTSFVFESVFKSCKPSVQAFRFIKCLPVTFVHVKSSEVKLIKPNVVVLQI